jgi:hypothetical protein
MKNLKVLWFAAFLLPLGLLVHCFAWECEDKNIAFKHIPSTYYGSGEYFSDCPGSADHIRCYHYHRHWICEKDETYYWDRNLESAARAACDCSLPDTVKPSAPAVSKKPETRFPGNVNKNQ